MSVTMRKGGGCSTVEAYWRACPKASVIATFQAAVPRRALPIFFESLSDPCFASRMKQPCLYKSIFPTVCRSPPWTRMASRSNT